MPHHARLLQRRWQVARPRPVASGSFRRGSTIAAASSQRPAGLPAHDPQSPVLVLAGFHMEELATVRQMMDSIGGESVRVMPTTPALLNSPAHQALTAREPAWDRPMPPDWQPGGGWGQQRMALMAGIEEEGRQIVVEMLGEAGMPGVVPAAATPDNANMLLGEVLAAALKAHRQGRPSGSSAVAAASVQPKDEADSPVKFVDELPPLEAVVSEVWQPPADSEPEAAATSGSEAVQAEYSEAPQPEKKADRPAATAKQAAGKAPLSIIDSIAADSDSSFVDRDVHGMDSEELLAAARAAMGLDQADLQKLVDDAAAQAASAFNVPYVPGGAAGPAAPAGPGISRKPWDTPVGSQAEQPSSQQSRMEQPDTPPVQRTKASTAGRGTRKAKADNKKKAGGKAGGGARQAEESANAASRDPLPATAADSQSRSIPQTSSSDGDSAASPEEKVEGAIIPPVESFVLSKSQLKAVTEKHGLDFQELLQGLKDRGISLAD